jgi:hypothetical protein
MTDLIRMASHSHHYLAIFGSHTSCPLYLGRSRRLASPGQRIVLHAKDRGCTHPGCTVPGYLSEVHHVDDWAAEWIPPPHLDTGQTRTNDYHHPGTS